jgi:hypothetical protein
MKYLGIKLIKIIQYNVKTTNGDEINKKLSRLTKRHIMLMD